MLFQGLLAGHALLATPFRGRFVCSPFRPCLFRKDVETGEGIADAPPSFPAMLFWGGMARTALIGYLEMGILGGFGLEITVFLEYGVIRGELLQRKPSNGL